MPSKKKRAMRRQHGSSALPALIAVLVLVAAALVILLMQSDPLADPVPVMTLPPEQQNFMDPRVNTAAPLVLGNEITPTPMIQTTPTPVPTPEVTAEPANGGNRLIPAPLEGDYFLPIFDKARRTPDDEAMIAITIDDCDDPMKMEYVVDVAKEYDAGLTLFPTGDALMNEELTDGFRTCALRLGYQIEGCTFDHKADYKLSDSELILQIWKQGIAASYAVGTDYDQHFFRPVHNGSVYDQRTHYYAGKLGFTGLAGYTYSYAQLRESDLSETLANGNVYQFDMSERSMALLKPFIAMASSKGYRLVTMNELFGIEGNAIGSELTIDRQTLPNLESYVPRLYDLKIHYRACAVFDLQERLAELGYLTGEDAVADGLYGPNTSIAVSAFQAKVGIPATGNASVETQERLYALDAPRAD